MTTRITVDAHAGWHVKVTPVHKMDSGDFEGMPEIVSANTTRDFHVHSTLKLIVEEIQK
jgi:hypothetical protein